MTNPENTNKPQETPVSPHEETGYDKPYEHDMTDDQARALHEQGIGGPDAERQAVRADDRQFFDRSLGIPEGTQDIGRQPADQQFRSLVRSRNRHVDILNQNEDDLADAIENGLSAQEVALLRKAVDDRRKILIAKQLQIKQLISDKES